VQRLAPAVAQRRVCVTTVIRLELGPGMRPLVAGSVTDAEIPDEFVLSGSDAPPILDMSKGSLDQIV
jgi:hypothetical protein